MKRWALSATIFSFLLILSGLALSQTDPGTADTVRVGTATATGSGQQVMVSVFEYNDEVIVGISVPLKFDGNYLIPDSVSFVGSRVNSASIKPVTIDSIGQTILFGAIYFSGSLTAGSGLLAKIFFTTKDTLLPDTVVVDTFIQGSSVISFVEPSTNEFSPRFLPGSVIIDVAGPPQPHTPEIIVPGPKLVFTGNDLNFAVNATDSDATDILTITKISGPGNFAHAPAVSPTAGLFSWSTVDNDTAGSPYTAVFVVDDGTGRADTGSVMIEVLPLVTPPAGQDGDLNGDGNVTLADVVYLVNYLFHDGPPPNPVAAGDVNGDCFITVADIIHLGYHVLAGEPELEPWCLPGDLNHDGYVNLPDVIYYINYLLKSGPVPVSIKSADVNADCMLTLADLVYLINFIFRGGPIPQPGCVVTLTAGIAPPVAEIGMQKMDIIGDILEIEIDARLAKSAAAVMLQTEFDYTKLSPLEPRLTSRSQMMTLHYNQNGFEETIGLLDLSVANQIPEGDGALIVLRYRILNNVDLNRAVRISYSEVVGTNAVPFDTRVVKTAAPAPTR